MDWIKTIPSAADKFGTLTSRVEDALETINAELAKRGTLRSDTIDYDTLAEVSRTALTEAAHIQAYRGAMFAATSIETQKGFETAVALMTRFFTDGWNGIFPKGKRAKRLKDAVAKDMHALLVKTIETQPGIVFDPTEDHATALSQLKELIENKTDFDVSAFDLRPKPSRAQSRNAAGGPNATHPDGPVPSAHLDARGRAELRQDILRLAERIASFEPDAAVTAAMRGYAAWMEHRTTPDHDDKGVTQQANLPRQLRDDLLTAETDPTAKGLARLEDRLTMSPDWFEGHLAAFNIAMALGHENLARMIQRRVADRLIACPDLFRLKYPNGDPYVPDNVATWIGADSSTPQVLRHAPDDTSHTIDGEGISEEWPDDLAQALAALDPRLAAARSPRTAAIIRYELARHVAALGHGHVANAVLDGVAAQIRDLSVEQWDTEFTENILTLVKHGG